MPDINEKLEKFKRIVLDEAAQERDTLLAQVAEERQKRLGAAEAEIKQEINVRTQAQAAAITAESGREISRRVLADKRLVAVHREQIAQEVFAEVREKLLAFTETEEYLPHMKKLYVDAFQALGSPFDGVLWLRPQDMGFSRELVAVIPGRHVQFREGAFTLGGLIVDCPSRLRRADLSFDTALGDLDGHFAEMFGLSLTDD